jgi:hypothetical protein
MAKTTAEKLAKAKEKLKKATAAGGELHAVREAKKAVKRAQRRTRVEKTRLKKHAVKGEETKAEA